jgi:hypothetical protein
LLEQTAEAANSDTSTWMRQRALGVAQREARRFKMVPAPHARERYIRMLVTAPERRVIEAAAREAERDVSVWIRDLALSIAGEE